MSIELHIFLPEAAIPTIQTWQTAIDAAEFPLKLGTDVDLHSHRGFLPAMYKDKETGFELYFDAATDIIADYPHISGKVGVRTECATFRWGGNLMEMCAALSAAASLAKASGGLYFYPDDDLLYEADEALSVTRKELGSVPI